MVNANLRLNVCFAVADRVERLWNFISELLSTETHTEVILLDSWTSN